MGSQNSHPAMLSKGSNDSGFSLSDRLNSRLVIVNLKKYQNFFLSSLDVFIYIRRLYQFDVLTVRRQRKNSYTSKNRSLVFSWTGKSQPSVGNSAKPRCPLEQWTLGLGFSCPHWSPIKHSIYLSFVSCIVGILSGYM